MSIKAFTVGVAAPKMLTSHSGFHLVEASPILQNLELRYAIAGSRSVYDASGERTIDESFDYGQVKGFTRAPVGLLPDPSTYELSSVFSVPDFRVIDDLTAITPSSDTEFIAAHSGFLNGGPYRMATEPFYLNCDTVISGDIIGTRTITPDDSGEETVTTDIIVSGSIPIPVFQQSVVGIRRLFDKWTVANSIPCYMATGGFVDSEEYVDTGAWTIAQWRSKLGTHSVNHYEDVTWTSSLGTVTSSVSWTLEWEFS
jgi:hypothetical protein